MGYFKGGREKYEKHIFETQIRELLEESGLKPSDVLYVDRGYVDETIKDGKPQIRYLLAKTKPEFDNFKFIFDKKELLSAKWYELPDALTHRNMFFLRRDVLRDAHNIIKNCKEFIDGDTFCKKYNIDFESIYKNHLENGPNKEVIDDLTISRTLAWILRHSASNYGLVLDTNGFIDVLEILKLPDFEKVKEVDIIRVVETNDKQRFTIKKENDRMYVKVNQGQSKNLTYVTASNDKFMLITVPNSVCIFETNKANYNKIRNTGINVNSRLQVHFTSNESNKNKENDVLIYINMIQAMKDNIKFYSTNNGLITSDGQNGIISPKYFSKVKFI